MSRKSPYTDKQFLQQLHIENLRGLENIELSFCDNPNEENFPGNNKKYITGIFGMNGSGKTTLLQTILCLYRPKYYKKGNQEKVFDGATWNTKMSRFFKHIDGNFWGNSKFYAIYEHDLLKGNTRTFATKKVPFSKTITGKKEWKPQQPQKFNRDIFYIPIQTSVPDIEFIAKDKSYVSYGFTPTGQLSPNILRAAHIITNIDYQLVEVGKTAKCPSYRVTKLVNGVPVRYHSFNMGAGEQRLFRILDILYNAPEYSLIAIDELDMTLHSAALRKLIMVIDEKSREKHLQVFFTSHRPELMDMSQVHSYYIMHRGEQTLCLDNPTADCYEELSGDINKPFVVYVEDVNSKAIVTKVLSDMNLTQRSNIMSVGTYHNCIVMLYAAISLVHDKELKANPADADARTANIIKDYVAILDGDISPALLQSEVDKIVTGGDPITTTRKHWVTQQILQYNSKPSLVQQGKNMCPEEFIHEAFKAHPHPTSSIMIVLKDIVLIGNDPHKYFSPITDEKQFTLDAVINEFATTPEWNNYVANITMWVNLRKQYHHYS